MASLQGEKHFIAIYPTPAERTGSSWLVTLQRGDGAVVVVIVQMTGDDFNENPPWLSPRVARLNVSLFP